jgi:hypothetical protein
VPTGPNGETTPFCHLRLDYLDRIGFFIFPVPEVPVPQG